MNQLTKFLVDGILNEGEQRVIAAYGGGFKPPTAGHFEVVKQALKNHPEIDEFIIYVGSGTRDGITQAESVLIWEIYQTYLPMKVRIEPSKAPIGDILRLGKNNPQDKVYFVLGAREENEGDFEDIKNRTRAIGGEHPNVEVKVITTADKGMSGTNARKLAKVSFENFSRFLPAELSDEEKETAYNIVKSVVKESLNENASYSQDIDIKQRIMQLTQHMLDKGMNIEPLPNVEFVDGDKANAREFLGKTAYYDPNSATIVLYTEGRHPKDIVRSFAHEMIHHIQNLEGRLGNITTTNTQEDDALNDIEAEANLKGTMTFRNWTDTLNENTSTQSFPNSAFLFGGFFTGMQGMGIGKAVILDLFKNNPKIENLLLYTQDDAIGFWKKLGGKIIQQGEDKKGTLRYFVQINKNDVDTNSNMKQLGISYKNLSTKKSKIDKGEYVIKMGGKKIGFFFVRDVGTIKMNPMNIIINNLNESSKPYKHKHGFDDKLGKDPFGLNAYALELARGLEEEIDEAILNEDIDLDKYVEDWLGKGGVHDDPSINRAFVLKLKQLGYKDFGTIYRVLFIKDIHKIPNLKKYIWEKYNGNYISFSKTLDGAHNFMDQLVSNDLLEKGETFVIIKQKSNYYDLSKWVQDEIKKAGGPWEFATTKDYWTSGLYRETQKTQEVLAVLNNSFEIENRYSKRGKLINEGRYDTLANQLSKIAFQEFKDIHDRGDEEGTFKFRVDHPDEEHDIPAEEFYFDFEGIVKITDDEYNVNGGANVGFDDKGDEITPILSVKFKIPKNPDWQKVSFDIKDVVRHELEHLTQDGENEKGGAWHEDPRLRRPSKYMQDDQFLRDLIDVNLLPKSDYFKLEKEVDAMLQGMYFKAKKSKTPFKNVLNDYLDIFVDQGSISKEEKENILDVWRSRRKALSLPSF